MDEINVLRKAMMEYDEATKAKKLNVELLDYLRDSLFWLFRYSEKYNIPLPKKDEILRMVERSDLLIEQITTANRGVTRRKTTDEVKDPYSIRFIRYPYRTIR